MSNAFEVIIPNVERFRTIYKLPWRADVDRGVEDEKRRLFYDVCSPDTGDTGNDLLACVLAHEPVVGSVRGGATLEDYSVQMKNVFCKLLFGKSLCAFDDMAKRSGLDVNRILTHASEEMKKKCNVSPMGGKLLKRDGSKAVEFADGSCCFDVVRSEWVKMELNHPVNYFDHLRGVSDKSLRDLSVLLCDVLTKDHSRFLKDGSGRYHATPRHAGWLLERIRRCRWVKHDEGEALLLVHGHFRKQTVNVHLDLLDRTKVRAFENSFPAQDESKAEMNLVVADGRLAVLVPRYVEAGPLVVNVKRLEYKSAPRLRSGAISRITTKTAITGRPGPYVLVKKLEKSPERKVPDATFDPAPSVERPEKKSGVPARCVVEWTLTLQAEANLVSEGRSRDEKPTLDRAEPAFLTQLTRLSTSAIAAPASVVDLWKRAVEGAVFPERTWFPDNKRVEPIEVCRTYVFPEDEIACVALAALVGREEVHGTKYYDDVGELLELPIRQRENETTNESIKGRAFCVKSKRYEGNIDVALHRRTEPTRYAVGFALEIRNEIDKAEALRRVLRLSPVQTSRFPLLCKSDASAAISGIGVPFFADMSLFDNVQAFKMDLSDVRIHKEDREDPCDVRMELAKIVGRKIYPRETDQMFLAVNVPRGVSALGFCEENAENRPTFKPAYRDARRKGPLVISLDPNDESVCSLDLSKTAPSFVFNATLWVLLAWNEISNLALDDLLERLNDAST